MKIEVRDNARSFGWNYTLTNAMPDKPLFTGTKAQVDHEIAGCYEYHLTPVSKRVSKWFFKGCPITRPFNTGYGYIEFEKL